MLAYRPEWPPVTIVMKPVRSGREAGANFDILLSWCEAQNVTSRITIGMDWKRLVRSERDI